MRLRMAVVLALATGAVAVFASLGQAASAGSWYWSPGLCKSNLHRYGMRLDDGRTFAISQALCVGKGGISSCEWNANTSKRLYNHFVVFARSDNGVVRGFDLYPTNRNSYRAEDIELASSLRWSAALFVRRFGPIAASLARIELAKGCAPYRG